MKFLFGGFEDPWMKSLSDVLLRKGHDVVKVVDTSEAVDQRAVIVSDPDLARQFRKKGYRVIWQATKDLSSWKMWRTLDAVSGVLATTQEVQDIVCKRFGFPVHATRFITLETSPEQAAEVVATFAAQILSKQKTVIVPIFDGAISKNIVDAGALAPLKEAGCRVLLWVYEAKADYYRERYGSKGYEVIEYGEPRIPTWANALQNFAIDCIPTRSLFLKHVKRMVQKKKYVLGSLRIAIWGLGHVKPLRWVIQHLELLWLPPLKVRALVHVERPTLIFCPTMVWLAEVQLARYAKHLGIRVVGMDKSWDNITSKLMLPVKPDHLIVPSERCAEEAEKFLSYPKEKITIVGLAQFDRYQESELQESREDFCARMGLDPAKPIILFCAAGLWMAPDEPQILLDLDRAIESGMFGDVQVLVRMHPKYDCGAEKLKDCQHLILDRPGTYVGKNIQDWEYEANDLKHIISSLKHAAVTINTASTMSIEAAYFDRPIINIGFDPVPTSFYLSVARYYEREHYAPIIWSKGVKLAKSQSDLEQMIRQYLAHPEEDHEGRERIIREQCVNREPIASQRLASCLVHQLP